jgi:hypothetical protein
VRADLITHTCNYIARIQLESGAIPWFVGGITDPWDHVESAMGLAVGGKTAESTAAYRWLARKQLPDGYWLAAYEGDAVADGTRAETNFVAYIATGVWHQYLLTGDLPFLEEMWPTVRSALDFVISLQAPSGEIYWALDTRTGINRDALITGCSSIFRSFACGIAIATTLGISVPRWKTARDRLGIALRERPERFDRTWESKARYSMDWFYPVLAGVVSGSEAVVRLNERWEEFVEPGLGCRCVSDQPWVTIAETCELIMACVAAGERDKALVLFEQLSRFQAEDGSWWTGYVFTDDVMWPEERPTWTAGAILLAADALFELTPAANLFTDLLTDAPLAPLPKALEGPQRAYRR